MPNGILGFMAGQGGANAALASGAASGAAGLGGGILGMLGGPVGWGLAAASLGSSLGLFGGKPNYGKSIRGLESRAGQMDKLGNKFLDPNDEYYREASRGFYNRLNAGGPTLNTLLGMSRAQGISQGGSNVLARQGMKASMRQFSDDASNFQSNLYGQGAQQAQGYFSQGNQLYGQAQGLRAQEAGAGADSYNQLGEGFLGIGASIFGRQAEKYWG